MSTSGQGDQKEEGKEESEITSTTSDIVEASVSVDIKNIEAVAANADSTVPLESKDSEAVNFEVTDSAIDSLTTTDSTNKGTSGIESEVAHCKTTPAIDNIPVHPECSNFEPEPCSSKTSDKDSGSFTEELELKWDEDDLDESIADDKIDQDIENESNKSTVDESAELIQKLDSVINESKNEVDKDLENESTVDETTQLIEKLDSVIDESKNEVDKDLENESFVDETTQLIQKLDSVINESNNVDKDLLENESNVDETQLIQKHDSGIDESKKNVDVDKDLLENESNVDETTQLIQKLDSVIDESKNEVDKDLLENESNVDETTQLIQKLDSVIDESKNEVDKDLENKSTVDETTQLIQKLDSVINESKNEIDKDLLENESNVDETTQFIQKFDSVINESKNVDVNKDLGNESNKSKVDSETAQLIQKLDSGIDESKKNFSVDKDLLEKESINVDINKDLETSSNQSSNQIKEDKSSVEDNNVQKDEILSSKDNSDPDKITSSIDNKIDDVEMTSTSFESQNIIDEIDNITEEAEINKDVGAFCFEEPNKPVDTNTPNLEMDIDNISTDELSETVDPAEDVKPELIKEEQMDVEIASESPLISIEEAVSNEKDKDKCKAAENETRVLKEQDTKVPLVDTTDKNVKEIIETHTKEEIKDLELNKSTNQIEDIQEIDEPNVNILEVSSVIDSKADSQKDTETINQPLGVNTVTNKNDSEKTDSKSIPIEDTECDTKVNEIEDNNTETNKNNSEKIDSSLIEESECDTKSNAIDSITDESIQGLITPNTHHRINKPNVMLDIPTQELSDIEAELDDDFDDNVKTLDDKNVTLPKTETDFDMKELPDTAEVINKVSVTVSTNSEELQSTELTSKSEVISTTKLEPNDLASTKEIIDNITSTQEITEIVKEIDIKNSVTEVNVDDKTKIQIDNEQPSTSKTQAVLEIPDIDNDQEVSDSLGLLAESSRVVDDNDDDNEDAEDHEVDDNDDEDFDPYEESNSAMAEDMDDSNTPPPELDPKLIKPGDKLRRDSDEDAQETMDIVDDIECDENDLDLPDDTASEIQSDDVAINKDQPEIIDADMHKDKEKTSPPDKIITILEKVLGSQITTGYKAKDSSVKGNVRNYVEVEGSSDSDDVEEVSKTKGLESASLKDVTGSGSPLAVPKTQTKMPKINTDEVSIKTVSASSTPTLHIPETTIDPKPSTKRDEIFNVDSDDDETVKKDDKDKTTPKKQVTGDIKAPKRGSPKTDKKCINPSCTSETQTYYVADRSTAAYYSLTRRSAVVCEPCRQRANERSEALINGIKDLRPLLDLDMDAPSQQLVEISDSDSDGERGDQTDFIGERGARFLEEHLADMINETWNRYEMESRLKSTETIILDDLEKLEADVKEIDAMLDECQKKTDAIRFDFYKDYETRRKNVGAIVIHDTPLSSYSHIEKDVEQYPHIEKDVDQPVETFGSRYPKRRAASTANDTPAKKPAIPLGYKPLDADKTTDPPESKADDDKEDISVVKLSAESAPADLPPPGEIVRPPLKAGMTIYAMRNAFGTWLKGKIMDVQPKPAGQQFSQCRVKFEHKVKNPCKVLAGRCLAYSEPSAVRMTIGTRVVALFKDPQNPTRRESFYSGVIAEVPNPVNNYRYLVFFDDGYAQYVHHQDTRIVCESSNLVWEEVHQFIREFIHKYLVSYPERPMVRLHAGEKLKTEWNGKWWDSKVLKVDASIALISFDEDNRTEWIYRGSTRLAPLYLELQAARAGEGKGRSRLPRNKALVRSNMPCVEYTRSDEQVAAKSAETQQNEEMRRQRAVAKKSTTTQSIIPPTVTPGTNYEGVISRVVYYTPKNAVKPYKMTTHNCTVHCSRSDLLSLKDLRTYNPLAKPLLSGWERQTVRYKGHREVVYRAPCGRRLRNMFELHKYLRIIQSDLSVDLFDFTPGTHCLAEFVLSKCNVSKKDLSHGKENVPVPCVNYYDNSLPEFCSYNTERTPTAGVPLNLDPEFLCGCDCTDDCMDKTKCACWKMTLEGARTIGLEGTNIGYSYRRLPEPLPSGIYECNSRCKCKQTCLNRVAQHPLQLKLQVFKTLNRGWGIRALNDVPKGSFLCVYAGNLLTDATANLDGLNEGDEYLAELDYIEVVEAMKEGYEDDIPDVDKLLDKKGTSASESEPSSESEEEQEHIKRDGDFQPGYIGYTNLQFKKILRKREKAKKKEEEKQKEESNKENRNDFITISDDEEVREPSRFTAEAGMVDKDLITKHSSRVSVRTLFGKDEACYIMDAKVQGNIGRYLNHSCHPNVFVQNVFVDTHDPRFPWVAFFALSHVRAGTELTWNYNYDVGSVPEKVLYCYCGAANCRGRLL